MDKDGKPTTLKELMEVPHSQKKFEIEVHRVNTSYSRLLEDRKKLEAAKSVDLSGTSKEELEAMDNLQNEIKESLEKRLYFVSPELTNVVPFHYPNLLLFGACTGDGKSTIAANIVQGLFREKRKTLILSNEEFSLSVFNRIACLELGFNVNNTKTFTPEMNEKLKQTRHALGDFVSVIDLASYGNANITASIEGMEQVLSKLATGEFQYDCVIVDYYQKVSTSQKNPSQAQWLNLQEFSNLLDRFYKVIKAPIVVLAQIHPPSEKPFEDRVKLGRSILMTCTFAMEIKAKKDEHETHWVCHKSRFGEQNQIIKTKWKAGKYFDVFDGPNKKEEQTLVSDSPKEVKGDPLEEIKPGIKSRPGEPTRE